MELDRDALDRWITGGRYSSHYDVAWCANKACVMYAREIDVKIEEEYGQGWATPEDCPTCNEPLVWEKPEEDEEDE